MLLCGCVRVADLKLKRRIDGGKKYLIRGGKMKCIFIAMAAVYLASVDCAAQNLYPVRIVDINADCIGDTIFATSQAVGAVPSQIGWGSRTDYPNCDSGYYLSYPPQMWLARTSINFEEFVPERCLIRVMPINLDNLRDLLLAVSGYREVFNSDSNIQHLPVKRLIAVPSQRGLDSLETITFRLDSGYVELPFPHVYLRGATYVKPEQDMRRSGVSAQTIPRLTLPVNVRNDELHKEPIALNTAIRTQDFTIRALPNPVESDAVTIEASQSIAGAVVELYSMQGALVHRATSATELQSSSRVRLDISMLVTGSYLMRVVRADGRYCSTLLFIRE